MPTEITVYEPGEKHTFGLAIKGQEMTVVEGVFTADSLREKAVATLVIDGVLPQIIINGRLLLSREGSEFTFHNVIDAHIDQPQGKETPE